MNKLQIGLDIIKVLNANSYEAYIVGGAVRDYILKKEIVDVDIATSATLQQVSNLFEDVSFEGKKYLSCRIHLKDMTFEVTTFRKDMEYIDHRHPVAVPAKNLKEDLLRRDFTMNALAMDKDRNIMDMFHGIEDIQKKTIRMIGDPDIRFAEDALRVLRALYFASKLNFGLDQMIISSFKKDYIRYLKEEYIIDMVDKIMLSSYDMGLQYIRKYNLLISFPFYQVLCEEALQYKYRKDSYSLFYVLHHFLPLNLRISSSIRAKAKAVAFWIHHKFNAVSLYYGSIEVLDTALEIYEAITGFKLNKEKLLKYKEQLPILNSKDIKFDWNKISVQQRNYFTKRIEQAILLEEIKNEAREIEKYLEIEE